MQGRDLAAEGGSQNSPLLHLREEKESPIPPLLQLWESSLLFPPAPIWAQMQVSLETWAPAVIARVAVVRDRQEEEEQQQ